MSHICADTSMHSEDTQARESESIVLYIIYFTFRVQRKIKRYQTAPQGQETEGDSIHRLLISNLYLSAPYSYVS